jgi:hypothetical protein
MFKCLDMLNSDLSVKNLFRVFRLNWTGLFTKEYWKMIEGISSSNTGWLSPNLLLCYFIVKLMIFSRKSPFLKHNFVETKKVLEFWMTVNCVNQLINKMLKTKTKLNKFWLKSVKHSKRKPYQWLRTSMQSIPLLCSMKRIKFCLSFQSSLRLMVGKTERRKM